MAQGKYGDIRSWTLRKFAKSLGYREYPYDGVGYSHFTAKGSLAMRNGDGVWVFIPPESVPAAERDAAIEFSIFWLARGSGFTPAQLATELRKMSAGKAVA